jgi:O-succinylbenzoic acid--CoA ligase
MPLQEDYFTVFENVTFLGRKRLSENLCSKVNDEMLQTNDLVEIKNNKQFKFLGE